MTKQKVFLGDDETDFMPIIPIGIMKMKLIKI
jgi:hypothetical protein